VIGGIVGLIDVVKAKIVEKTVQIIAFVGRNLQTDQYATESGAVIAVMKQRNIPASGGLAEKIKQRAGAFRKFKTKQHFIMHQIAAPADHVADVQFGQFVIHQINHRIIVVAQGLLQLLHFPAIMDGCTDKYMRFAATGQPIIEFGDAAIAVTDAAKIAAYADSTGLGIGGESPIGRRGGLERDQCV